MWTCKSTHNPDCVQAGMPPISHEDMSTVQHAFTFTTLRAVMPAVRMRTV